MMSTTEEKRTILVVEDDADVRDAIALALSMENFLVQVADRRESALAILATQSPSIIILDWFMPGMPLEEFVEKVARDHPKTRILMTSASMKLQEKAEEMGLKYYLSKPFEVSTLLALAQACTSAS